MSQLTLFDFTKALSGQGNQGRTRQKVLWTRCCRSLIRVTILFRPVGPPLTPGSSGMRGLPALIWDGSVLDAGSSLFNSIPFFLFTLSR